MSRKAWSEYMGIIYPRHIDHDRIVSIDTFQIIIICISHSASRRIPSHHNFDFELSRWCHCHPKQEWPACDTTVEIWVMSNLSNLFLLKKIPSWKLTWPLKSVVGAQGKQYGSYSEDILVLGGCICRHFLQFLQELWNGSWTLRLWERSWWVPATLMVLIKGQGWWPCSTRDQVVVQTCLSRSLAVLMRLL